MDDKEKEGGFETRHYGSCGDVLDWIWVERGPLLSRGWGMRNGE